MPLYVFRCPKCQRTTECLQRYTDRAPLCAECWQTRVLLDGREVTQHPRMERQPTAAGIAFNGGGWARDGYSSVKK